MSAFRSIVFALSLLCAAVTTVYAQAPAAVPPGMTQEQFDSLVEAISNSVTEKLKAEGIPAAPAPAAAPPAAASKSSKAPPPPKIIKTPVGEGPDEFAVFIQRAKQVVLAIPVLGRQLAAVPGLLDQRAEGGGGAGALLLLLALVAVVAVAAESILRRILSMPRTRLAVGAGPEQGLRSLAHLVLLALLDGLGVLVVFLICHAAVGAWFTGSTPQDKLAAAVLKGIFSWRLYVLLFRIVLQPDVPNARLCDVRDVDARAMYMRISAVMLLIILARILGQILVAIGTPIEAMGAYQVFGVMVYLSAFLWLVVRSSDAARQWFGGLSKVAPLVGRVGNNWVPVASTFFVALGLTQIYGAISGRLYVGNAMVLTLMLVVGVLMFETLMQAFVRRLDSQLVGSTPASDSPKLPDVVARCVRVAVLIGVIVIIAETWVVQVLGLANESEWDQITRSSRTAGITLFLAYVLWELFKYATDPYMGRKSKSAAEAIADGDAAGPPASRISTMMPLLRAATAVLITIIAVMVALESFGVNITPLIAGASVFGIAISFGSQTLVKDIVSGVFYLSDDAFRVGEYIDCGKAKGTVEGFTLRSIKLRHQNGQVHTIPFGQLGQITNFSRDWITVKFNMRFAGGTDIEKLRKAAKKIGADIAEMPAFKDDLLAPFKMQGVADVAENALLVRFKFTARPGNPAAIQREAVKRMFNTFPGLGIEFAKEGAAVVVHTAGTTMEPASATSAQAERETPPGAPAKAAAE
ncbi:MAG: mechanosensitive ion channel family protein [Reyranella sp.]|uniref:mechanosensitive ion channel family protein n=1 Tax=Reyranella sp. TaxID=1929291 RepID=UPI001208536A|nr:mechanosensitive ion channel domain-containing protein [Reyranella sp.]TAJ40955.1 MAG: mechanosensitive ion channel family protein [Reyranella sp.]